MNELAGGISSYIWALSRVCGRFASLQCCVPRVRAFDLLDNLTECECPACVGLWSNGPFCSLKQLAKTSILCPACVGVAAR